jgi:hypothetical protein
MSHTKEAAQQKRRMKAMPVLEAAGLSFSLASGASATIGSIKSGFCHVGAVAEQMMDEEQISEVSLATFHLFDNECVGPQRPRTRPTMIGQGACGADLYYPQNPPAVSGPVHQPTSPPRARPIRPAYKYKRS